MPFEITSVQNPRIKEAVKLRDRRGRDRQGKIIIDGARELAHAIEGRVAIEQVFCCGELCRSERAALTLELCESRQIPLTDVTRPVFEKLAFGEREDGLVAVAHAPHTTLAELSLPPAPLIAIVEGVEKPGNLGAICRTADGAGVNALIAADPVTDLYNPNAIRASLGTIFRVRAAAASPANTRDWLREHQVRIYAARVGAAQRYDQVDLRGPVALVLGNEATGLSPAWQGKEVTPIAIPMQGTADSLNVAAAAAVLLYEALRQRQST